jgi:hypothetical protein
VSVENLQEKLTQEFFQHTKSPRKASGRAMGTFLEIITYYLLVSWNLKDSLSIEIALPEYGNSTITHNVEYSLHPIISLYELDVDIKVPITSKTINQMLTQKYNVSIEKSNIKTNTLLRNNLLKNGCLLNKNKSGHRFIANLDNNKKVIVTKQLDTPYVMFECKRVGRDAKNNKGPQAIEKAKQGSYVAKSVSSLQKIWNNDGTQIGVFYNKDDKPIIKPYSELINEIIESDENNLLQKFILTVGIVSNHGNWFTSENQNKEMMVLTQSYDWLLFITDQGLTEFVNDTILNPNTYPNIGKAFRSTYSENNTSGTQFTKINMNYESHLEFLDYFKNNLHKIESWINIIQPKSVSLDKLKEQITTLKNKKWS